MRLIVCALAGHVVGGEVKEFDAAERLGAPGFEGPAGARVAVQYRHPGVHEGQFDGRLGVDVGAQGGVDADGRAVAEHGDGVLGTVPTCDLAERGVEALGERVPVGCLGHRLVQVAAHPGFEAPAVGLDGIIIAAHLKRAGSDLLEPRLNSKTESQRLGQGSCRELCADEW